jgi:hypothetical protein
MRARAIIGLLVLPAVLAAAAGTVSAAAADSTTPPAAPPDPAAQVIASLGLHVAPNPVRERSGWHPPRVILVNGSLKELLPQLRQTAPAARIVEIDAATPRDIAAADATFGVCSAEVLKAAQHLEWIQWPAAGVERCVQQPLVRERAPLVTNLQRTMGPASPSTSSR